MKKVFVIFLVALVMILTSCSYVKNYNREIDYYQVSDNTTRKIIEAINQKDYDCIKELFSVNTQNESDSIDKSFDLLLEYIDGDIINYSLPSEQGASHQKIAENGKIKVHTICPFWFETQSGRYLVGFKECVRDDFDPKNIGILSFYIINEKDWTADYHYGGNSSWEPGIHIDDGTFETSDIVTSVDM